MIDLSLLQNLSSAAVLVVGDKSGLTFDSTCGESRDRSSHDLPGVQEELVAATPSAHPLHVVRSPYGHDGFLVEKDQVGTIVPEARSAVPLA